MGVKKGENSKKAAGNAKKAEVAAQKRAVEEAKQAKFEDEKWAQGAKDNSKKKAAEEKAAEAQRKKAEKDALLQAEEASLPSKPKGSGSKSAQKKGSSATPARGLDLSQLEPNANPNQNSGSRALNASGIDDSIAALSLATGSGASDKVEKHPERRFKAAYSAFEERRLEEMKDDKSLRRQQKIEIIRKEFEKSEENPFNQALVGRFDMSREEMAELRQAEREKVEGRLQGD